MTEKNSPITVMTTGNPAALAEDRVMCPCTKTAKTIFGSAPWRQASDRLDRRKNCAIHYNNTQPNSIRSNYVSCVLEDAKKNLWVATAYGIDVLERQTGRFIHYSSDSNQLQHR